MAMNITSTPINQGGSFFRAAPSQILSMSPYNNQQSQMLDQLLSQGSQGLSQANMGYEPIRKRIMSEFQSQVIPSIAERFASMGEGSMGSSAFRGALEGGYGDLAERLSGLGTQYNQQMAPLYLQMMQQGLQPREEQMFLPGQQGSSFANILSSILGGAAQGVTGSFMGNPGAALGGLSSALGGIFGGGGGQSQSPMRFGNNQGLFSGGMEMPSIYKTLQNPGMFGLYGG